MNNKLKQIIFDKLYQDLKHLEIIPYDGSIFFINRETKYWYLEYEKSGELWWRWDFFTNFFALFSMERNEYEPIISEWVEQVLNYKVKRSKLMSFNNLEEVEEVLNCKVKTSQNHPYISINQVEEVLNCKVKTSGTVPTIFMMEEVLNCKVKTSNNGYDLAMWRVEEVLYHKNN